MSNTTPTTAAAASRTNLGPLTTTFTYPSSCNVAIQGCATCDYGWQAQTCSDNAFNAQGVQDNPDCWPARATSVSTGVALNGWGFYSPGIQCPVGYATSCVATEGVAGGFNFQFELLPSETAIGCCPTGFQCSQNFNRDTGQTCISVGSTGSFAAVQCSSGQSEGFTYLDLPATVTETVSSSESALILETFTLSAPLFQLNFQSSDLPSTVTGPITITTDATTSSASTFPQTASSASGGLSTGAKAGIGVGAGLAVIALFGALLFYFSRRRKRPAELAGPLPTETPKPELAGQAYTVPTELHANPTAQELPGNSLPVYK
ncbi:hypothetical protein PFICI_14774 [Pestalotiopsis fici W106-1]|uniref:Uncharacterized protein n=1 Tax=Pestalotiopsis fici (strain W106-1 / CGMCC3.15140) TaxID=1229662 RepID=W3WIX3_PESFW|nr:uncharacterized protein PFICI_14774 [Pestalotiopsis fici W106-1]ETS73828.1 hypothetical protein PFICI_14774 [Pestalotiopsis fici W106-1]